MVTFFFLKIVLGVILGIVTGIFIGYGDVAGIMLGSIIATGWWIGVIFLLKHGFSRFVNVFIDAFMEMMNSVLSVAGKNVFAAVVGVLMATVKMVLAIFVSSLEGWKELIREVRKIYETNADLQNQGYVICRNIDELRGALSNKQEQICLENSKHWETLVASVCETEPWLKDACFAKSIKTITDGTVGKKELYNVSYHPLLAVNKEEVIEDTDSWNLFSLNSEIVCKSRSIHIITQNLASLKRRISQTQYLIPAICTGVTTLKMDNTSCTQTGYCSLFIDLHSVIDKKTIEQGMEKAESIVGQIDKKEFGGTDNRIPKLMKIFMTYVYFQTEYHYDDNADEIFWNNFESQKESDVKLALFSAPFFVIMNRSGTSVGFSTAFKTFMNHFGIKCEYVIGEKDNRIHMWNIVKFGDSWYHVDTTCGFDKKTQDDVYIQGFMRTDKQMKKIDYQWDNTIIHSCVSERFGYAKVEEYINENRVVYDTAGANDKYFDP